jgi:hypothetical protein
MALGYYPNVSIEPSAQVFVPQRAAGRSTRAMAGHLASFIRSHRRLMVLTGAGCSTASGIPDYRDRDGAWKHPRPVQYQDFVTEPAVRQRYWARSVAGWQRIAAARPNQAHLALARLETRGALHHLITQNVDGLHQRAGSICMGVSPQCAVSSAPRTSPVRDSRPSSDSSTQPGRSTADPRPMGTCTSTMWTTANSRFPTAAAAAAS